MVDVENGPEIEVHVDPSEDLIIVPPAPTATNLLAPNATLFNALVTPDVRIVQDEPLDELATLPESPTATATEPLDASPLIVVPANPEFAELNAEDIEFLYQSSPLLPATISISPIDVAALIEAFG